MAIVTGKVASYFNEKLNPQDLLTQCCINDRMEALHRFHARQTTQFPIQIAHQHIPITSLQRQARGAQCTINRCGHSRGLHNGQAQ